MKRLDVRPRFTQIVTVFIAPFLERHAHEHSGRETFLCLSRFQAGFGCKETLEMTFFEERSERRLGGRRAAAGGWGPACWGEALRAAQSCNLPPGIWLDCGGSSILPCHLLVCVWLYGSVCVCVRFHMLAIAHVPVSLRCIPRTGSPVLQLPPQSIPGLGSVFMMPFLCVRPDFHPRGEAFCQTDKYLKMWPTKVSPQHEPSLTTCPCSRAYLKVHVRVSGMPVETCRHG